MYLSHPVRRMREDPIEGATVDLVVELGEADPAALREAAAAAGGSVEADLGFDTWLVRVPETGVAKLCDLAGIERIETDNTLSMAADEDVEADRVDGADRGNDGGRS